MLTVGGITGFTVIAIAVLIAVSGVAQAAVLVSSQVTMSPFTGVYVYVLPAAVLMPFTFHCRPGDAPPFTGVAE